jgi:fluoroacetyl-CoA thioesterase
MTTLRFTVTDQDTAIALGSGDVPVLATPRLLAWMEQASVVAAAASLDASSTTVGIEVWMRHRRATPVGAQVDVEVTEVSEQDRGMAFGVVAREVPRESGGAEEAGGAGGTGARRGEIAEGRVVRAVVDRQSFLRRL